MGPLPSCSKVILLSEGMPWREESVMTAQMGGSHHYITTIAPLDAPKAISQNHLNQSHQYHSISSARQSSRQTGPVATNPNPNTSTLSVYHKDLSVCRATPSEISFCFLSIDTSPSSGEVGGRVQRTKDINKNRQKSFDTSGKGINERKDVQTLKRAQTYVGAPQSTLGPSPGEKVDAADLDFILECDIEE
jgi:hypothetical protein